MVLLISISLIVGLVGLLSLPPYLLLSTWILYHFVFVGPVVLYFRVLPKVFFWLSDLIVGLIFLRFYVTSRVLSKERPFVFERPVFYYLLFLIFSLLSGVFQEIPLPSLLLQLKDYGRYFLLGLAIMYMPLDDEDISKVLRLFVFIFLLQIPVTILQFIMLVHPVDLVSGTFGRYGTKEMVLIMTFAASVLLIKNHYTPKNYYVILSGLTLVPVILGVANFGIYIYPFTLTYLGVVVFKRGISILKWGLSFSALLAALIFTIAPLRDVAYKYWDITLESVNRPMQERLASGTTPGRLMSPIVAWRMISEKDLGILFGYGFGITKESAFTEFEGEFAYEYAPRKNQIGVTIFEDGLIGTILLFLFLISAYRQSRFWTRNPPPNSNPVLLYSFELLCVIFAAGFLYMQIAKSSFFAPLWWSMYALVYRHVNLKK